MPQTRINLLKALKVSAVHMSHVRGRQVGEGLQVPRRIDECEGRERQTKETVLCIKVLGGYII